MSLDIAETSKIPKELLNKVSEGECILFIGAGVHSSPPKNSKYKYPQEFRPLLGRDLAEIMAADCDFEKNFPKESLDLKRVSLCYEIKGPGRSELVDFLDRHVQKDKKPSPALEMLADLPFKIIITTNYDSLFDTALVKFDKKPHIFVYSVPKPDLLDDPTTKRPLLFKMHGNIDDRDSIVITDEDYITFVQQMTQKEGLHPVPETVLYRMMRWPTLFVGYSLHDYNLRLLFRTLHAKFDSKRKSSGSTRKSYSIDESPDDLILQVWQNQEGIITFLTEDLWAFVPALYKAVQEKKNPA